MAASAPDEHLHRRAGRVEPVSFTFMPEFVPVALLRLLQPIERLLETSALNVYSAHYMTVLRKPGHGV